MEQYATIRQSIHIRQEEWFVQALYEESKDLFDWQPLLEELNAYIEDDMIRYWDIPKACITVLRKHFPEITNFSTTHLSSIVDHYDGHKKGLLKGAIHASMRCRFKIGDTMVYGCSKR